ncbi:MULTISPECIES: hypothetical protein [Methanobacterium]|jgi:hypothetical protein|uniref:Uncharacterized protein n=1 Tax=Methanobacterium veterum TaxID=408577 RepID=A0A9E4ZXJ2_9EURY|nr:MULTISPECIES: hypothetical protein [Methanobacterium]MCZ3365838.1 hypothetical protein [Methanobacterium veterum]MCZ3371303.1 hypothetical protein [Methanobacterium veterum]
MASQNIYSRKISPKEAKEDFIFVLKNKLPFFPPIGTNFELSNENISREVMVKSYPCTCRGPDRPHEHYFISWKGLEAGDKIEIAKDSESKYNLQIKYGFREVFD